MVKGIVVASLEHGEAERTPHVEGVFVAAMAADDPARPGWPSTASRSYNPRMVVISPVARQQPGAPRRPCVPEGSRVYAIGDIHGRADLLGRLHEMVAADARAASEPRKVIVYLGDYVDRGRDSRGVIEELLDGPLPGFESVFLLGNHDEWMRDFLCGADDGLSWILNGGDRTLESYGVRLAESAGIREALEEGQRALREKLPPRHWRFLAALALSHIEGDYLFVHAGIRPGVPLEQQEPGDLIWIREEFLDSELDHGHVVVHGHTPSHQVELRHNRIGIDTAAHASARLTCLVLTGGERRFMQT